MPEFHYIAYTKQGNRITGKREASNEEALISTLIAESLTPLEISLVKLSAKNIKFTYFTMPYFMQSKVTTKDLQMFCQQLYTLLKAGIPMISTISKLVETTQNKTLQKALTIVLDKLNDGQSLSVGLTESPQIFIPFFINLVRVGEHTGKLEAVLLHLIEYLELEEDTRNKIKGAYRYPKMVCFALLTALFIISTFVIPAFSQLFTSFNQELPIPTQILIITSNFIIQYWYLLIGGLIGAYLLFRYVVHTSWGAIEWSKLQLHIPIMGWIIHRIILARFAKLFAMVLRTGFTAVEGLELVSASTNNAFFAAKIKEIAELIRQGYTIAGAITQSKLFSPLVIQIITVGEESGNLDILLDEVAEFYQRELIYDIAHLSQLIEPILLVVVGIFVLILALGVFLPMWDMASRFK